MAEIPSTISPTGVRPAWSPRLQPVNRRVRSTRLSPVRTWEWRAVFDEYDPPRMAVAETWHPITERTFLYARPTELGQVFDFSLLESGWESDSFRRIIQRTIAGHAGGSPTWVLSSHDVPRHATRLALPAEVDLDQWLLCDGVVDAELGRRRARAATLMRLALPGSPYVYQGEELGLLEVADLPEEALRDPVWRRSGGRSKDATAAVCRCRGQQVWTSFGFGSGTSWLPQPAWFAEQSVEVQRDVEWSTLSLYRARAAAAPCPAGVGGRGDQLRGGRRGDPELRPGSGFRCVMNLTDAPHPLPQATILLASETCAHDKPPNSAVWLSLGTID